MVWETKSVSHFHCVLSLCDVVSLSQLVTCCRHSHRIPADIDEVFRGILGFFGTCGALRGGSWCRGPLGWGNDPDAKLLALVTQWDTCPAAPVQPPTRGDHLPVWWWDFVMQAVAFWFSMQLLQCLCLGFHPCDGVLLSISIEHKYFKAQVKQCLLSNSLLPQLLLNSLECKLITSPMFGITTVWFVSQTLIVLKWK